MAQFPPTTGTPLLLSQLELLTSSATTGIFRWPSCTLRLCLTLQLLDAGSEEPYRVSENHGAFSKTVVLLNLTRWEIARPTTRLPIASLPKPRNFKGFFGPVCKWNLRFDERKEAVVFLERLEELTEAYALTPNKVLKTMPELLYDQL